MAAASRHAGTRRGARISIAAVAESSCMPGTREVNFLRQMYMSCAHMCDRIAEVMYWSPVHVCGCLLGQLLPCKLCLHLTGRRDVLLVCLPFSTQDGLLQQEVARCRKGRDRKGAGDALAKADRACI